MSGGWDELAKAWIASMGERGDWSREHVLDAAMLARIGARRFRSALDVGCGEGRFCRILQQRGLATIGVDPTAALLEEARRRDPAGAMFSAERRRWSSPALPSIWWSAICR